MHPAFRKLRLPVVAAPLFIISTPQLVIAQCKAGIVGSMPALNARPSELLDDWLAEITEELAAHDRRHPEAPAAPFAINQIVHRSNDRLDRDMAACERFKVPIVITSLGAARRCFITGSRVCPPARYFASAPLANCVAASSTLEAR